MPGDLIYHTYVDGEGRPRIDPGPLVKHGEGLTVFFFNEINRARPQVQSLLLRAMAERSVSAFDREFVFPHMTVFADRNKVERRKPSSSRPQRVIDSCSNSTWANPTDRAVRASLVFDPVFHDTETLLTRVASGIVPDICSSNRVGHTSAYACQPDDRTVRARPLGGD